MNRDNDDKDQDDGSFGPSSESGAYGSKQRREPVFSGFDDDDEFEEPERDTDFAAGYTEGVEEDLEADDIDDILPDRQPAGRPRFALADEDEDYADDDDALAAADLDPDDDEAYGREFDDDLKDDFNDEDEIEDEDEAEDVEAGWDTDDQPATRPQAGWAADRDVDDDDYDGDYEEEEEPHSLPWAPIAVAAVALILLFAGGYGVIQQRAETEEELRQLRAELATAAKPQEVTASRAVLQELKLRNEDLEAQVATLTSENARLRDTVAGLEALLATTEAPATGKPAAVAPPPQPAPAKPATARPAQAAPAAKPAPAAPVAATGSGGWFVNFGSYNQHDTAVSWLTRIQPESGRAIIAEGTRDGKTYYRVRVIDLPSEEAAQRVARALEGQHGLSKLWVGRE